MPNVDTKDTEENLIDAVKSKAQDPEALEYLL